MDSGAIDAGLRVIDIGSSDIEPSFKKQLPCTKLGFFKWTHEAKMSPKLTVLCLA